MSGRAAPLPGATIVLVDSTGRLAAGTISDHAGRFALRAAMPGTYRVRVRRIGFAPDTAHVVVLATDAIVRLDPVLRAVPSLEQLTIRATRSCDAGSRPDSAAVRVWDAIQGALTATLLTPQAARIGFVLRRYEREVDPGSGRVLREQSNESRTPGATSYASISADSLAVHGFVRRETRWSTYYAPDAGTLISDSFVAAHCFHLVRDSTAPALVGLAFVPSRGTSSHDDVAGALWLEPTSSELRFLDFTYRRPGRTEDGEFTASGRVEYRALPAVGWIVSRWRIRVPIAREVRKRSPANGQALGSSMVFSTRADTELVRIFEAGGEVLSTFSTASAEDPSPVRTSLDGRLVEKGTGRPVRDGVVRITREGTAAPRTASTDSTGAFLFDDLEPGSYALSAGASAEALTPGSPVDITKGTRTSLTLSVPPLPDLVATLCPAGLAKGTALVQGSVTEAASDVAAAGVTVRIRWNVIRLVREDEYSVTPEQRLVTTSRVGSWAVCGVPRDTPLYVSVIRGTRRSAEVRTQPASSVVTLALQAP